MKLRRTLSGFLLGLGCAVAFIGFLALILPAIPNNQLRLVLASFEMSSSHWLVSAVNTGMSFALRHGWQVLFLGLAMLLLGVLLFLLFSRDATGDHRREEESVPTQPLWEPQPFQRPNPFADLARWDAYAPAEPNAQPESFARFSSPLLERNRFEEADAYRPPAVEPQPAAQVEPEPEPLLRPAAALPASDPEETVHMTFGRSMVRSSFPLSASTEVESEPAYTPNEEEPPQPSPRIRSTMGRHREWL